MTRPYNVTFDPSLGHFSGPLQCYDCGAEWTIALAYALLCPDCGSANIAQSAVVDLEKEQSHDG